MSDLPPDEAELVETVARTLVRRQLAVPAVLFLESMKPVSFLAGQALRMVEPLGRAVLDRKEWGTAAALLEDRDKLEELLLRIEALEAERSAADGSGTRPAP